MFSKFYLYRLLPVGITLVLIGSLLGCTNQTDTTPVETAGEYKASEEAIAESNDKLEVYVVQDGYDSKEPKQLIVASTNLPDNLVIKDESKNQIMTIQVYPDGSVGEKILGHAEFSLVETPGIYGVYEIESENILADFSIEDNQYKKRIKELSLEIFEEPDEYSAFVLLESYELFPEAFGDDWGIDRSNNGIPDVLDLLKDYISSNLDSSTPYIVESAKKYNDLIGGLDKNIEDKNSIALEEIVLKEDTTNGIDEFWSNLTYLNSSSKIDIELADEMVKKIIQNSEEVLSKNKGEYLFYGATDEKLSNALEDMVLLSVTDKIIPAYEYQKLIISQMNYARGLNSERLSLNLNDSRNRVNYILVLAHLVTKENRINELYAQEN